MSAELRQAFEDIGADLLVRMAGTAFAIDVRHHGERECYQLT